MALDFKTMSTEKKVVVCAALAVAALGLVALIISFTVYGSVEAMIKGEAGKAIAAAFGGGKISNPLGGYGWIAALSFFALIGVAAINFFKAPQSKLVPSVPFKFVIPAVAVLAGLLGWIYLSIPLEGDSFMGGDQVGLGVIVLILVLCYTALFCLLAFEDIADIKKALPNILLAVGGLFLLIAVIKCVAYPGMQEAAIKAGLKGKDSIPSPLGMLKAAWIINSLCLIGYGALTFLSAKDED